METFWQQYLELLLPLLFLVVGPVSAQTPTPVSLAAFSTSSMPPDPDLGNLLPAAQTSSSMLMPTPTDHAQTSSSSNNASPSQQANSGILNYYFLLLAVFVIIIALVWWSFVRRNRQKMALSQHNRQSALARDLEGMPGSRRWPNGRFGFLREPASEEGLDERGVAPPPYMPVPPDATVHPDATHNEPGAGQAIPLQDMPGQETKPPDYDEHTAPTLPAHDVSGMGPSTQPQRTSHSWLRPWQRNIGARKAGAKPDNP